MSQRDVIPEESSAAAADVERLLQIEAGRKSVLQAYVLWFFFALLAGHRFYLRRFGSAVVMLLFGATSIVLALGGIVSSFAYRDRTAEILFVSAIMLLIVPVIWALVDYFLIPGLVRRANQRLRDSPEG